MATFDLDALLRKVGKPKTRAEALRDGDLVDCTRAAAWLGFRVSAAMTVAAWEETVGRHDPHATARERADAGDRLRSVWAAATAAVSAYQAKGVVLPSLRFLHRAHPKPRQVHLVLRAGVEAGIPYVTLSLEGEA